MGTDQGVTPWQSHRLRSDGERPPSVYRGGAVDCANRQPVARLGFGMRDLACDVDALLALGQERRVAADPRGDPH
jgi:hypothetical protein